MKNLNATCDTIRETGFALHKYLKHGLSEKVYEDGFNLGDFYADLLVEDDLVIELKAVRTIADEHVAQLLGYLRATRKEYGLLINFGAPIFSIKRYTIK